MDNRDFFSMWPNVVSISLTKIIFCGANNLVVVANHFESDKITIVLLII